MEVGTGVDNVKLNQDDIEEIGQNEEPYIKETEEKGKTDVPKEIVNDSQESLEGALDDKPELVKEISARFLSTIIIASNTHGCIMVVIILLLCI
ncbi:hypothetical protein X943_001218 [Babesia divergens]|uniref:Uncharacterized protein n=1 Tax=Babesia divergens TaxID=32595 RepID=A0AAD9G9J4_BABDI|nr:hypothetical protein X943_001218 [Babesia divergens]